MNNDYRECIDHDHDMMMVLNDDDVDDERDITTTTNLPPLGVKLQGGQDILYRQDTKAGGKPHFSCCNDWDGSGQGGG